jgi:hypothetical protein
VGTTTYPQERVEDNRDVYKEPLCEGGPTMSGQPSFEAKGLSAPEYVLAMHELADNVAVLLRK